MPGEDGSDYMEEVFDPRYVEDYDEAIHGPLSPFDNTPNYQATLEFLRLRWQIKDAPIAECIRVLKDPTDPDSTQQPLVDADGTFHEIAQPPFSYPPTKTMDLNITEMDGFTFELDDTEDKRRDVEVPSLEITSGGDDFISIRQYIEQVHPSLVSVRDAYFDHYGRAMPGRKLPPRTELWFNPVFVYAIEFFLTR